MQSDGVESVINAIRQDPGGVTAAALAELSDPDRDELGRVIDTLRDIDFEYRRSIVSQLVELGEENVDYTFDRIFMTLMEDEDEEVRELILETYDSASETLRASALYAMGQNADTSWLTYVREEMESDSEEVRFEAAGAAGRIGDERLIPALARMGMEDNTEIQGAVVTALSAIGGPAAQRVLRRFLQHSDENFRELALDALESMQSFDTNAEILRKSAGSAADAVSPLSDDSEDDVFENFDDDLGINEELDDDEFDEDW